MNARLWKLVIDHNNAIVMKSHRITTRFRFANIFLQCTTPTKRSGVTLTSFLFLLFTRINNFIIIIINMIMLSIVILIVIIWIVVNQWQCLFRRMIRMPELGLMQRILTIAEHTVRTHWRRDIKSIDTNHTQLKLVRTRNQSQSIAVAQLHSCVTRRY